MSVSAQGAIDCDLHPALASTSQLLPYLDEYWRHAVINRELDRYNLASYPPAAPLSARPDWRPEMGLAAATLDQVRTQALDHFGLRHAILNVLYGGAVLPNDHLAAALCTGINKWVAAEWLDQDPRLRASIVISLANVRLALEEIERCADDRRFVQILVLVQGEVPLGREQFWPIYEACVKHGLPLGIHAGSSMRHPPTQSGFPSYYIEDYAAQSTAFAAQMMSLLAEGVLVKFPELKVVMLESGVSWLPAMMWRLSKDWRSVRPEVPWIKRQPAGIIRDCIRLTVQPLDAPPDPADLERLLDQLGSEDMLLFATDYPHWQFDGDQVVKPGLPERLIKKMMVDNPLATYPRLKEAA